MTTTIEKNIRVIDSDGDWYSIPPYMKDEFDRVNEILIESENIDEWQKAYDEIRDVFGEYME